MRELLSRLGLDRPELRAWALYDWANSAFVTVIITAVYPIFFQRVAVGDALDSVATQRHAMATFWALAVIALIAPFLGALADFSGIKKKLLAIFIGIGVAATAAMVSIGPGDWKLAAALFMLANIGAVGSLVFSDSLLPHIAAPQEVDRVSTAGYAVGYLGGGLLLALCLLAIQNPGLFGLADGLAATRFSFIAVALWWLIFSLPLLLRVPEPPRLLSRGESAGQSPLRGAYGRVLATFRELRRYRQAFLLLLAIMVYSDGVGTIYRMATIYGAEIGLPRDALITAILMVQFLGLPFTFLFGLLAARIGAKRAILCGIAIYIGISYLGFMMRSATHFYALAVLVSMVQGGTQALSRSLFASVIPRHCSSEFFGFFAVFEKFAGTLGPLFLALVIGWTGSSRIAVLAIVLFFLVGGALLLLVDVDEGRRAARAAEDAAGGQR